MKTLMHRIAGHAVPIHFVESYRDYDEFYAWLQRPRKILAVDTETTGGGEIFRLDFGCRLVQFGDSVNGGFALPVYHAEPISRAVLSAPKLVMHNAAYDLLVLDRHLGLALEDVAPKTIDTYLLSHIIDNRDKADGGIGHELKELAVAHVDPASKDSKKELHALFAENGWKQADGWRRVPLTNETYWRYGVVDTILTAHLFEKLVPYMGGFEALSRFEHALMRFLLRRQRAGLKVDVGYLETLHEKLLAEETTHTAEVNHLLSKWGASPLTDRGKKTVIASLGWALGAPPKRWPRGSTPLYREVSASCDSAVRAGLLAMGENLTKLTDTGRELEKKGLPISPLKHLSVDKEVLWELCDVNADGERMGRREPNPLAEAVRRAKRAHKWDESYVMAMLEGRDENNRVHPWLNSLKARTARMSVSGPPFQQLPSREASIRHGVIADDGHTIVACDFSQIEPRILAGLSDCRQVIAQAQAGEDIYDAVAKIMFGPDFTPAQRKRTKIVYLGRGYQGGLRGLTAQTGEPESIVQAAIDAIDGALPETRHYGKKLMREMERTGKYEVRTPLLGRRLYIDEDKAFACVNHMVQSTARDIFAQALLDIDAAGLGDTVLMPVHDEAIGQAPTKDAEEVAHEYQRIMSREFMGVPLPAEAKVYGRSWGCGYE